MLQEGHSRPRRTQCQVSGWKQPTTFRGQQGTLGLEQSHRGWGAGRPLGASEDELVFGF